jgi:hypothetical protein
MKNIFLLPTEKPSRLFKFANELHLDTIPKDYYKKYHIYITSDEDIKEGDWGLSKLNEVILFGRSYNEKFYNKIILTTDQDLIADGVQAIDDEFLEWFVKNPSCEEVEVNYIKTPSQIFIANDVPYGYYKIIIPQEDKIDLTKLRTTQFSLEMATNAIQEAKQETLEEAAANLADPNVDKTDNWIAGAKWMLENLQDFDTWKEWKDMASKEEIIVTEYRDGNIKVETFKSK